jgi:hypothetical protein
MFAHPAWTPAQWVHREKPEEGFPMKTIVIVIVVVAVLVVAGALLMSYRRKKASDELQQQFGPEYDRTVEAHGDQRAAEADLADRQERRAQLDIQDLDPARRSQFAAAWQQVQAGFVDEPSAAVSQALVLVRTVMAERGYPTEDLAGQDQTVSVDHPEVMGDYREAVRVTQASEAGQASTEDLREAMVRYRRLFDGLLGKEAASEENLRAQGAAREENLPDSQGKEWSSDERARHED